MRIYIVTIIFLVVDFLAVNFYLFSPAKYLQPYFDSHIQVYGYIEPLSVKHKEGSSSFIISCDEISLADKSIPYKDKLRVYIHEKKKKGSSDYKGDNNALRPYAGRVIVAGKLEELRSFANPGSFDMKTYNWVQGLGGMVTEAAIINEAEASRKVLGYSVNSDIRLMDIFALLNLYLRAVVEAAVDNKQSAALMNGMVLGGSSQLSEEIRESFSNNGLSHLLSVSGTHIILLGSFISCLLDRLSLKRKKKWLLLVFLMLYACLCGLKPPILRALGMSAILLWGNGNQDNKTCKSQNLTIGQTKPNADKGLILCVLCMVLLIYKPIWILDLGFQLSFGATFGLLWLLPKLKERFAVFGLDIFTDGFAVTLAAQLTTLPILVGNFYTVSLIAFISNLLLVPVLELSTVFTLVGMLGSLTCEPLGGVALNAAAWLVEQVSVQADWLQAIPLGIITIGTLPVFCAGIYYIVLCSWLDLGAMQMLAGWERKCTIFTGVMILLATYLWQQYKPFPTTIYFMDVGQGDGAVIVSERQTCVIDTGGLKGIDTGSRIVAPLLRSLGRSSVDIFIPSHADYDHIGGAVGLARNMKIKKVILPNEKYSAEEMEMMNNILKYVNSNNIEIASEGAQYDLGDSVLRIMATPKEAQAGNAASTVVELEDKTTGKKILFTGDLPERQENEIMNLNSVHILKVAHHGSKSSTSSLFLQRTKPKLAVISCGYRNMYGHPHRTIIERLQEAGCNILRTDESGCIQVELLPQGIKVKEWRR